MLSCLRPLLLGVVLASCGLPPHAAAQSSAAQTQQVLTADSPLRALLLDARTRPVMGRHLPNLANNPHFNMIQDWPLRRLATDPHARGLTAQKLAEIEADLAVAQSSANAR